jgi:hypothetical protein
MSFRCGFFEVLVMVVEIRAFPILCFASDIGSMEY